MPSVRILLLEDDWIISKELAFTLQEQGFEVVGVFDNGEEVLEKIQLLKPDLALIDIELAGDLTGIDTALEIKKMQIPFVFLTAMADLATIEKAKLANPYAYLVKPIQPETLLSTIEISLYNAQIKREIAKQEPIAITNTALGIGDNIFVKSKKRLEKIKVADILWIQADDIYSIIITATGKYILSQALKNLEDKFPAEFMRVHRSYIVQLDKIQAIEDNDLIIKDNYIPIGKTYRDRLMAKLSFF